MARGNLTRAVKLTGTEQPEGKRRVFAAGAITAMLDNGGLRYIRFHCLEVLRGIAYLVRDKNWGTYSPVIEGLKATQGKNGFSIRYSATCKDSGQGIRYDAEIKASAEGHLTFNVAGTPLSDFVTNRTGFVVLHPLLGVVGRPVEIIHADGTNQKARFPNFISPGQPVFEIRSLKHTLTPGVTATVLMEGNKFEMEDHRNWMDASYKTYVCSLLDPWPYTLKSGETFHQSITLEIEGKPMSKVKPKVDLSIRIDVDGIKGRIPMIGVSIPMAEAHHALARVDLLKAAGLKHLVCQIDGRKGNQSTVAAAFRLLQEKTGIPTRLEIILPANAPASEEVETIAQQLRSVGFNPVAIIITQAHDLKSFQPGTRRPWGPSYEEMAAAVRQSFKNVPVGGGMLSFFTELNRKPPPKGIFDFIVHSVCPTVHAADDLSVMETLESIPSIIASTRNMIGKTPYYLGPSSIACRDNPYGAALTPNLNNTRVCLSDIDPRQRGLFAAAWNVGLLAASAAGGIDSVTLGAATGPQGAIYRNTEFPQPGYNGRNAEVYPIYHVLSGLARAGGFKRLEVKSDGPSKVSALGHQSKYATEIWIANLTAESQRINLAGISGPATIHHLNDRNFLDLIKMPLWLNTLGESVKRISRIELGPYGVMRINASSGVR